MVPVNTLVTLERVYGPETVTRNNLFNAVAINGLVKPGYSSGDAIKAIKEVAEQYLPRGYAYEWSGMTREETSAGTQTGIIFILSIIFVYFLLAAQYESYILPLAVLLSVPTGILGVFAFINLAGIENNIYVQVGLIMLIGLLAKNAILIVEYAVQRRKRRHVADGGCARSFAIKAATDTHDFLCIYRGLAATDLGHRRIGTGQPFHRHRSIGRNVYRSSAGYIYYSRAVCDLPIRSRKKYHPIKYLH